MEKVISVDHNARSRRDFFAKAGAVLAVGGLAPSLIQAQTAGGDVAVLSYALRLERLEATFYTVGLAKFAATDFAASNFAKNFSATQVSNAYSYFQTIQQHETSHVAQITAAITSMGGTLPPADCYGFQSGGGDTKSLATADSFIAVAMLLENTGVMAYDGAISTIQSPTIMTTAATIATVEARHAAFLNQLNGVIPFPNAYDSPAKKKRFKPMFFRLYEACPRQVELSLSFELRNARECRGPASGRLFPPNTSFYRSLPGETHLLELQFVPKGFGANRGGLVRVCLCVRQRG